MYNKKNNSLVRNGIYFSAIYILFVRIITGMYYVKLEGIKRSKAYDIVPEKRENINRSFKENFRLLVIGFIAKFGIYKYDSTENRILERFKDQEYNRFLCYRCHEEEGNIMIDGCNHVGLGEKCIRRVCQVSPVCLICNNKFDYFYKLNYRYDKIQRLNVNDVKNQKVPDNEAEIQYRDSNEVRLDIENSENDDESKYYFNLR